MTYLITLLTYAVFGLGTGGPTAVQHQALMAAASNSALPINSAVNLPEVIVTAPRVPADSVDVLMAKYSQAKAVYPLLRSMSGYGVIVVAGIFAAVWIVLIISGMAEWPHEPRIPREKPHVHLHDMFQQQPVAVYDLRKKRLDARRRSRP